MHETGPFSIPAIRNFVPEKLKPYVIIFIVIIFQLSGGIYLASVSEMVGSLALMQEDIMMAGYSSFAGMSLTFAIMFRLKFRFTSKASLLICATAMIIANLICMHTNNVPTLIITCFISGMFRMWGTFECNSTIQLWLTPKRDLSIFFCFIYLLVHGCIQLSGLVTVYTAYFSTWEYVHLLIIGLLLFAIAVILVLFRTCRTLPKLPLYGVDWMGGILWGLILNCILFVCIYGDHYDWYDSHEIRFATGAGLVMLGLNLWRASFIRHPFIANTTWLYKSIYMTMLLYILVDILIAPSHVLEHAYMETILKYDSLHLISMNWIVWAGICFGVLFTYRTFALRKWPFRTMAIIAFSTITAYLIIFYMNIDYNLPKESFILPLFLRGFGYVIIAITFLTALAKVPFQHFFETVTMQAFVSACFGGVLGSAVIAQILKVVMKRNAIQLGASFDNVNYIANRLSLGELYGALQQHALMVSIKEIYGLLTIVGLLSILCLTIYVSDIRPKYLIHPTYRTLRRWMGRTTQELD